MSIGAIGAALGSYLSTDISLANSQAAAATRGTVNAHDGQDAATVNGLAQAFVQALQQAGLEPAPTQGVQASTDTAAVTSTRATSSSTLAAAGTGLASTGSVEGDQALHGFLYALGQALDGPPHSSQASTTGTASSGGQRAVQAYQRFSNRLGELIGQLGSQENRADASTRSDANDGAAGSLSRLNAAFQALSDRSGHTGDARFADEAAVTTPGVEGKSATQASHTTSLRGFLEQLQGNLSRAGAGLESLISPGLLLGAVV
ncbi:hypothetical protein [Oleiagrimonas sp. C23AA]|uniref:hypothetical protein n=1 Tax=Oleiagrimonas sp. C23AA TaxID=2719047 RepID=UPI0014200C73|nr:hypothetical protein [Oleiagrimonas sp. C23AA]NII09712.1 hypothetical protein [Oleiagrimonas sp. C23AA]